MVDRLSTTMLSVYQFDESGTMPVDTDIPLQAWEALHIAAFDDERLTSAISTLSENDKADLLNGTACLVKILFLSLSQDRKERIWNCL